MVQTLCEATAAPTQQNALTIGPSHFASVMKTYVHTETCTQGLKSALLLTPLTVWAFHCCDKH